MTLIAVPRYANRTVLVLVCGHSRMTNGPMLLDDEWLRSLLFTCREGCGEQRAADVLVWTP